MVLPLVVLVVIFALGIVTGEHAVFIAMMAVVPMMAAVSASVGLRRARRRADPRRRPRPDVRACRRGRRGQHRPAGRVWSCSPLIAVHREPIPRDRVAGRRGGRPGAAEVRTVPAPDPGRPRLDDRAAQPSRGHPSARVAKHEGERVVAFLDCDLFKSVNEQYGSDVGDEFLQAVAGRLRHRLPAHDTVARWDGDEFLLAISADGASARPALERLVAGINGTNIRTTAGPIPATVSVGAAVWAPGQELESVISRSGRALYAAKTGGRGQIVVDGEDGALEPASR